MEDAGVRAFRRLAAARTRVVASRADGVWRARERMRRSRRRPRRALRTRRGLNWSARASWPSVVTPAARTTGDAASTGVLPGAALRKSRARSSCLPRCHSWRCRVIARACGAGGGDAGGRTKNGTGGSGIGTTSETGTATGAAGRARATRRRSGRAPPPPHASLKQFPCEPVSVARSLGAAEVCALCVCAHPRSGKSVRGRTARGQRAGWTRSRRRTRCAPSWG